MPPSPLLLFIRHGHAAAPKGFYPDHHEMGLSDLGRRQAADAARDLTGLSIHRLVVSPLPRALQTAHPLAQATTVEIETDERLEERVLRPLYGMSYEQIGTKFGREAAEALAAGNSDTVSLDGVDDLPDYRRRVSACLAEIGSAATGLTVIVAHGGPHDWYLGSLLSGTGGPAMRRWFTLGRCRSSLFRFHAGSTTPSSILGVNLPVYEARRLIEAESRGRWSSN